MENKNWTWGYTMQKVPSSPPFACGQNSFCSLETSLEYLGQTRAVFMNPAGKCDYEENFITEEEFCYLNDVKEVIVGITHLKYKQSAIEVAKFSLTHKNITGVIIDDFLEEHGPSKNMTVEELKDICDAMHQINPDLKMWIVRYSRHPMDIADAYMDHIDGIIYWVWISTDHYWRSQYENDTWQLKQSGKKVLQGVFVHNYGEDYLKPMPMDLLKLQMDMIARSMDRGEIDGMVFLQNSWMSRYDHREQMQFIKDYCDWFYGTHTDRRDDTQGKVIKDRNVLGV